MTNLLKGLASGVLAVAAVGCSHDRTMAPPGPGPTALPQSDNGTAIPPAGGVNTESHMGGPMTTPGQP